MVLATGTLASQAYVLVAAKFPSLENRISKAYTSVAVTTHMDIKVSEVRVMCAARGAVADPAVRVWTYTLDGHDFYVIRLGTSRTLVYDNLTKMWYNWGSGNENLWKPYCGTNWQGADAISGGYGSNVIVGDDSNGSLYFLDPDGDMDDSPVDGVSAAPFERQAYAQIVMHGYDAQRCFGAFVLGSNGYLNTTTDTTVTLSYSDDRGDNYTEAGDITIASHDDRAYWRSLGSMRYPGRMFKVTDYGAFKRLDSMDIVDDTKG